MTCLSLLQQASIVGFVAALRADEASDTHARPTAGSGVYPHKSHRGKTITFNFTDF